MWYRLAQTHPLVEKAKERFDVTKNPNGLKNEITEKIILGELQHNKNCFILNRFTFFSKFF